MEMAAADAQLGHRRHEADEHEPVHGTDPVGFECFFEAACIHAAEENGHDVADVATVPTVPSARAQAAPSSAPKPRLRAHKGGGEGFFASAHYIPKFTSPKSRVALSATTSPF